MHEVIINKKIRVPNGVSLLLVELLRDKKARSGYKVCHKLQVDIYEESEADSPTLPILYEGRLADLFAEDEDEEETTEYLFEPYLSS